MPLRGPNWFKAAWRLFASLKTGILLVILVVVAAAAGTVILQRPLTPSDQMARAYSPQVLMWLDRLGLTDIYHQWWFLVLLLALSVSIICASVDRWPNAWRFFARPYKHTDQYFRAQLPMKKEFFIRNPESGIVAAERAFTKHGFRPQRVGTDDEPALFAEKYRFVRLAVFVVHASLLLILLGGIIDSLFGYRGMLQIEQGQKSNVVTFTNGRTRTLPFAVRCDAAGQENYQDGTPKRWWSDLTIVSGSSDVYQKQIVVNDPLVYRGIRFYQASYWVSGDINRLKLIAVSPSSGAEKEVTLPAGGDVRIDDQTTARITRFIPDYYISDNNIAQRSAEPVNPAIEIVLSRAGQNTVTWVFPAGQNQYRSPVPLPYELRFQQLELKPWTGLEVSYEPGQWAVWSGCVLMALALVMTFYFAHTRLWAVPLVDKRGRLVLWVGSNASKPTPQSESIFRKVAAQIEADLETDHADAVTAIHDKKRINPVADAVQRDAAVRV